MGFLELYFPEEQRSRKDSSWQRDVVYLESFLASR